MERIEVSFADPTKARVIVLGQITLKFEKKGGKIIKTGSSRSGTGPLTVSDWDFSTARQEAIEAVAKAVAIQNMSHRDIAECILNNAHRDDVAIPVAFNIFFSSISARWCDHERRAAVLSEIDLLSKNASHQKAAKRQKDESVAIRKNRQYDMFGGGGS